jgi:ABC-type multidrug transport system fused ATPase/permease subunit
MALIIKSKKHYLTRFPLWLILIVLFAIFPALVGLLGSWIVETSTGEPCHEGNCIWMVIPWLSLITVPAGGIALIVYLVIVIMDSIQLMKAKSGSMRGRE